MCRAAQEAGAHTMGILTRRKKTSFSHFVSWCSLIRLEPNLLQSCLPARGVYIPNFKELAPAISKIRAAKASIFFLGFFFLFSHNCKNCYKIQMRAPITLTFGTQKSSPKTNPSIKCGTNPINGSGIMTDYSRKTRSICCHAYRVNRFM